MKITFPNLGQVTCAPVNPTTTVKTKPTDWRFLENYDAAVKGVYLKLIEYKNTNPFVPSRLRRDDKFIKTLNVADAYYKDWCKKSNNSGRYSLWSYEDRWGKIFTRMWKLGLIMHAPKCDHNCIFINRSFVATIDDGIVRQCKKDIFTKYL